MGNHNEIKKKLMRITYLINEVNSLLKFSGFKSTFGIKTRLHSQNAITVLGTGKIIMMWKFKLLTIDIQNEWGRLNTHQLLTDYYESCLLEYFFSSDFKNNFGLTPLNNQYFISPLLDLLWRVFSLIPKNLDASFESKFPLPTLLYTSLLLF